MIWSVKRKSILRIDFSLNIVRLVECRCNIRCKIFNIFSKDRLCFDLHFFRNGISWDIYRNLAAKHSNPLVMEILAKNYRKSVQFIYSCLLVKRKHSTSWKVSKYGVISGPYFPAFELNSGKLRTRNYSVFGHFSRSGTHSEYYSFSIICNHSLINPSIVIDC